MIHGQGTEVLFAATSDRLPQSSNKDGRATDSCFVPIGAHQCGVLMVDGWMNDCFCIHPKLNTCGFKRNNKGGYSHHVQKTNHCINWEGATVQRRAEGFWLRRTVEAIQIKKATPNMNLDSGLLLPMVWNPILKPHPTHPLPHT